MVGRKRRLIVWLKLFGEALDEITDHYHLHPSVVKGYSGTDVDPEHHWSTIYNKSKLLFCVPERVKLRNGNWLLDGRVNLREIGCSELSRFYAITSRFPMQTEWFSEVLYPGHR